MKVKNLVLFGFVAAALNYLSVQMKKEEDGDVYLDGFQDIDLDEIRREVGDKLSNIVEEFGGAVSSIVEIGSDAFERYIKETNEEDGTRFSNLFTGDFDDELLDSLELDDELAELEDILDEDIDLDYEDEEEVDEFLNDLKVEEEALQAEDLREVNLDQELADLQAFLDAELPDREVPADFENKGDVEEDIWVEIPIEEEEEVSPQELQDIIPEEVVEEEKSEEDYFDEIARAVEAHEENHEADEDSLEAFLNAYYEDKPEEKTEVYEETLELEEEVEEEELPFSEEIFVEEETNEEDPFAKLEEEVDNVDSELESFIEVAEEIPVMFSEETDENLVNYEADNKVVDQTEIPSFMGGPVRNEVKSEPVVEEKVEEFVEPEEFVEVVDELEEPEEIVVEEEMVEEEPVEEEVTSNFNEANNLHTVYTQIHEMYPYLDLEFISNVYDLKEVIAANYPLDEPVIVLHRINFNDLDDLRQFVEIVSNHGYNVNVDENKMIVDTFRRYINSDGKILTNIFEIANQANLLRGHYEGYRIDVVE